jgi:hypothetical protein
MKITKNALRSLFSEAIEKDRIIHERPWSVEYEFSLSGGSAEDSEGKGPDGFAVIMIGESGKIARVIVDTYWNPNTGDQSGNSLKFEVDGQTQENSQTYVPVRFDDGEKQRLIISNAPVQGLIAISHAHSADDSPVVHLIVPNPFGEDEDVDFSTENLGNGTANVDLIQHTNM